MRDAAPAEVAEFEAEVAQIFEVEVRYHFANEEELIFPLAQRYAELQTLVAELLRAHLGPGRFPWARPPTVQL